jgi:hypothetical protein
MGQLVHIHTAPNGAAGWVLRGRLESEDIPVFTKGEAEGPYRVGPAYLYVPEEFEVQARLIIDQLLEGGLEIPEDENWVDEENLDRDLEP